MYMNEAFDSICFKGSIVSQSARFVYLCLCKHADNTNQTCFPSLNRIAQIVGKSISTIKRAMRELCKYGAVERTPRFRKDGGQTSNLYKIMPCNFEEISKYEAENEVDQAQFEMSGSLQEDISFSESEYNEPARPCTTSVYKNEQDNREQKNDENNSFEEPGANTIDNLGEVHIFNETTSSAKPQFEKIKITANRFKLSKYINCSKSRVLYWFKSLNQKIHYQNLNIFKKMNRGEVMGDPPGTYPFN
ncbi:helix-turn-helix domain-containing protein [Ruminiclostridium cellulolyticum]|uniref:Helix-turn-helix domain-containing protein n=1 Tax=Ruminiclostridium cellulolyticum (strain ATCC 35319 / DSM 5812 / JCM 6584 / H10) TaxID=394503 RepID=B8I088_RUMCH|nr:helix-turn-helix domain-containing protein [Ruminiclostridium cellulolyticum]ACL77414.1 hypothetical protein Ccel_3123 [Ruminiclostridium cellulolyticum H10]